MRRGHPGRGGWRGDSQRHFRPRTGGSPGFRPPRPFAPVRHEMTRFPAQTAPRFPFRPPQPDQYHDRNKFQMNNRQFDQNQDQMPPRPYNRHHDRPGIEEPAYSQDHDNRFHVNSMGDVDQRQQFHPPARHEPFGEILPPWACRNRPRPFVRHEEIHDNQPNKLPVQDMAYSGHRPPASDHYEGRGPGIDNSNTFKRSVDDTVDIIRKKLQNRNDPQSQPMSHQEEETMREPPDTYHQRNMQQELTPRKKMFIPRQNLKTNCDQIKNKIVHQLFKMDKDRIHKLMDNPNSSTKFEYAINSLITESQNSFNRNLRETAEKSLCGTTRNNMVPYDDVNDTIYEDTFMKQMQCILDPQDTILLEDIKPIVMAELNKVLQLNDFDNRQSVSTEEVDLHPIGRQEVYDPYAEYAGDPQSDPQYYETHSSYNDANHYEGTYRRPENRAAESNIKAEMVREKENTFTSPPSLFERRAARKSCDYSSAKSASSESRRASVAENASSVDSVPYFDANAEHLSDDEDPFAELDKQYHVAVDHNFIAADDMIPETSHALRSPPQRESRDSRQRPPRRDSHKSDRHKRQVKQEIRCRTPDLPLEMLEVERKNILSALDSHIKSELLSADSIKDLGETMPDKSILPPKETALESPNIMKEQPQDNREREEAIDKSDSSNMSSDKSSVNSNSRKRSTDQRPSHRKEKRKKSESSPTDAIKQILNKNIVININDCAVKPSEKHNSNEKSVLNLNFSKESNHTDKEEKKSVSTTSNYTEKYVKRKESPQKPHKSKKPEEKDKKDDKKDKAGLSSPNHSTSASKETNTNPDQGTSKGDCKIKLKPIDMFTEQPKKVPSHQAHRNTATPVKTPTHEEKKIPVITIKPVLKSISKQVTRKHVATQIFRKMCTKVSQTEKKLLANPKLVTKCIQTDPVSFEGNKKKSTDAFERMKEIDMEIQILLQEKFKLYNSLEAKEVTSSIQNLGMTVLNVEEKDTVTADSIIDEFTNIPEDELAEIALESVANDDIDFQPKSLKKTKPGKTKQKGRNRSQSPATHSTKRLKKAGTPNISLLEQIIEDDRPLEDIISLDDLETSPVKPRSKRARNSTPKTYKPKKTPQRQRVVTPPNQQKARAVKPFCQPDIKPLSQPELKPCTIVLTRIDVSNYLKSKQKEGGVPEIEDCTVSELQTTQDAKPTLADEVGEAQSPMVTEEIIEEPVANDFHYQVDMLDVSEDIVIGGDEKIDDKESESMSVPITDEVVLDNSQSGEDVGMSEVQTGGCKMYDFSADEDLKHDAVGVSGNGDAVLAIEFVEQNFLAACLDGNVYHFSPDGQLLTTLRGSNLPVTCLTIVKEKYGTTVYTGSLDSRIRYYDLEDGLEKGPECNVLSPIQTMDRAWDTVFVGTRTGFVLQFECKNNMLIPVSTIKFSDQSILALRALKEGPRKVLLVAARSENVTVKDAQTGLLLRTLTGPKMTVYTLLYEDGKVYCGTSSNQVQVFDYASGAHIGEHDGGKGAVCLRAAGGLVFAGCYDGCVYVFRSGERRPFAQLRGPGVMLLSLAVVGSKIIAGYKDRSLYIWKIPVNILQEMVL